MKTAAIIKEMKEDRDTLIEQIKLLQAEVTLYDKIITRAEEGDTDDNGIGGDN